MLLLFVCLLVYLLACLNQFQLADTSPKNCSLPRRARKTEPRTKTVLDLAAALNCLDCSGTCGDQYTRPHGMVHPISIFSYCFEMFCPRFLPSVYPQKLPYPLPSACTAPSRDCQEGLSEGVCWPYLPRPHLSPSELLRMLEPMLAVLISGFL